jgi:hypothetical protein
MAREKAAAAYYHAKRHCSLCCHITYSFNHCRFTARVPLLGSGNTVLLLELQQWESFLNCVCARTA